MRILFLTHYFPPESNAPANRVHAMAKHWVQAGHHVDVITCAPNVPSGIVYPGYRNQLIQHESIDGIRVTRVWTHLAANAGFLPRILNYVSFLLSGSLAGLRAQRPDVVIATSPQPFCGWAGALISRCRGLPFVLEIRDIWPESISAVGAMSNQRALRAIEWLSRRLYAIADRIVTVGDGYSRELRERGVPAEKIDVIPNGVDLDRLQNHSTEGLPPKDPASGAKFICSYVGTVGMAAGLEVVLRAARSLRDRGDASVEFWIVGDGAERRALETKTREIGLEGRVRFWGRVDKKRVGDILASSDACLVHLKEREIFHTVLPSKLFEAAGARKPILLGVRGDAAHLVEASGGGITFTPERDRELVDAILELSTNPRRAREMGRSGYDFFTKHFNRRELAARYLGSLEYCVASESGAARSRETERSPA